MRLLKRTNGSDNDSETTFVTETVILGAKDKNMPAALVVDENGIVDIEKLAPKKGSEHDVQEASGHVSPTRPKRNILGGFLKLARQPENALIQAYYKSNIRNNLINRFEWYRNFEGQQQLNNKLANLYGGTSSPANNLICFVKNNVLVSLILIGVSFQLSASYLSSTAENYRYAEKEKAVTELLQAAELIEPDYSNVLNHCAVTNSLRQFYGDTRNTALKDKVTTEVEGFIKVYSISDIEQWYADQQNKVDSATAQIQSTLPRISTYRDQIAAEISTVEQQQSDLQSRLNAITNSDSQRLNDINKSIKLRSQLAALQTHMKTGPFADALAELDSQHHRLNTIISGGEAVSTPTSDWVRSITSQDQAALIGSIRDTIDKDVDANIGQASRGTPETKLYRLQIVVATLRYFGDLIGHLQNSPNYFEAQVGTRQNSSNQRIRELLGEQRSSSDAKFLDYDNCLTALNTAPTKLTIH